MKRNISVLQHVTWSQSWFLTIKNAALVCWTNQKWTKKKGGGGWRRKQSVLPSQWRNSLCVFLNGWRSSELITCLYCTSDGPQTQNAEAALHLTPLDNISHWKKKKIYWLTWNLNLKKIKCGRNTSQSTSCMPVQVCVPMCVCVYVWMWLRGWELKKKQQKTKPKGGP